MFTATLAITPRVIKLMMGMGYLVLALFVLIIVVSIARKLLRQPDDRLGLDGFSINELQQLNAQGKITTDEFQRAKLSVVNQNRISLESQEKSEK